VLVDTSLQKGKLHLKTVPIQFTLGAAQALVRFGEVAGAFGHDDLLAFWLWKNCTILAGKSQHARRTTGSLLARGFYTERRFCAKMDCLRLLERP
jgi:hypothetical protein